MLKTTVSVLDDGTALSFTFDEIMKYHGFGFPGGVAHAFKVMEIGFPLLDPAGPIHRKDLTIHTAFRGPGARDAFEMVTRAVTGDRYVVDEALLQTQRGPVLQGYYFRLLYRGACINLQIKPGHVRDDFIALGRKPDRTEPEEQHLTYLKREMTDRLLALPATEIYELAPAAEPQ